MSKEDWLLSNSLMVSSSPPQWDESKKVLPVCLVNNGLFTAAGIAFSKDELQAFCVPSDRRPKRWFTVETEKLLEVEPSLKFYLN
jgi:hypothetical protein